MGSRRARGVDHGAPNGYYPFAHRRVVVVAQKHCVVPVVAIVQHFPCRLPQDADSGARSFKDCFIRDQISRDMCNLTKDTLFHLSRLSCHFPSHLQTFTSSLVFSR